MSKRAKTIQLFLMDGEANGRIKASISNWSGVAFKIPRTHLELCKERNEFNQSSVYFLFGEENGNPSVYIGQAGLRNNGTGILARLSEHDKKKAFWDEAVIITTTDDKLGATELSFLENTFCSDAIKANRYNVTNDKEPSIGNITEEKESEMLEFADLSSLILGALGYKIFEPVKSIYITNYYTPTKGKVPPLPNKDDLKIGAYVRLAMRNLSNSGYIFSDKEIQDMCTPEWTKFHFGYSSPFMRIYTAGVNKNDDNGYMRFWKEVFEFGKIKVLITKEWYKEQFEKFDTWYNSL